MTAMTAWFGDKLVGAIPLEPRWWQLRPGYTVPAVHQTAVGVLPEYRRRGLGSLMQERIHRDCPFNAQIATVFREDETSPAYRWYRRNGFQPAMRIVAWLLKNPTRTETPTSLENRLDYEVLDPAHPGVDWAGIERLWQSAYTEQGGGFVCRLGRPRRDWLGVHPYRGSYSYRILQLRDRRELEAYAILGVGRLHSDTVRVEIMEHAVAGALPEVSCIVDSSEGLLPRLVRAVSDFAVRHDYRSVRWAMAAGDPAANLAASMGFVRDWVFDLLLRPLHSCEITLPDARERSRQWRYHSLDYA